MTNNQVEYEITISRMTLDKEIVANHIKLRTDSQMVVTQITGDD